MDITSKYEEMPDFYGASLIEESDLSGIETLIIQETITNIKI